MGRVWHIYHLVVMSEVWLHSNYLEVYSVYLEFVQNTKTGSAWTKLSTGIFVSGIYIVSDRLVSPVVCI